MTLGDRISAARRARTSGAVSIAYEVTDGAGPYLVLVHGLGYGSWGWGAFAERLAERRRLVLVDNRGIGGSDAPPGPYSVAEMAADLMAVLDEIGADRCDLLGASLGGMIALDAALDHPQRFGRIVLVATTAGIGHGAALPAGTARLLRGEVKATARTARRLVAGALSPSTVARRPQLVEELLALRAAHPQHPDAWRAQATASATFSIRRPLSTLDNEVLVLAGRDDAVIDPRSSEHLAAELPNARLELLDGLGHLSFFEAPETIARIVEDFLAGPEEHGHVGGDRG